MMPIVVHQRDFAGADANTVKYLKAATDSAELRKSLQNGLVADALVGGCGNGRQGVLHIMAARRRPS